MLPICSFTLLKALAKSNDNLFAIAFKSEKDRDSWQSDKFREKQRTDTKKDAKRIKSDNYYIMILF